MPKVDVRDINNNKVEEIDLSDMVFTGAVRPDLMHTVVKMQLANRRQGTASSKTRAEVSGGGRKPWRQKGTGRARAGSNTSPLWKRGGAAFGPKPRDYSYSVPKKIKKAALRSALSLKLGQDKLLIVKELPLKSMKTREIVNVMENLKIENGLLIINNQNEVIEKSARNVAGLKVLRSAGLNVYDLLRYEKVVILQEAVPTIEGLLS
jgi:large subunit ribosomal protein L4